MRSWTRTDTHIYQLHQHTYNFYNKGCWSNLRAFFLLDEEDTNPLTAGPALEKKKKKKKKIKRGAGGEVTQMAV